MTLDTYAHLFDDDLDAVASALGRAREESIPENPPSPRRYGVLSLEPPLA